MVDHDTHRRTRPEAGQSRLRLGLSGKLLVLTILFVMIAEVLIYVPSIANFRLNWLNDRLAAAHTAALVLDAAPSGMVPESLARQILGSVGARAVAMKMGSQRRLLAVSDMPPEINHDIDMRQCALVPRHPRCLRHAAVERQGRDAGGRAGADGRRLPRDRAGRGAAAAGDAPLLDQHHAAVAGDLRHHRDAGLSRAALSPGAADAPDHREHDAIPRRSGESGARHRRLDPPGRDGPRRARAGRHAARPRLDAAAEEPSRGARARGVEDQPRSAQPAHLGAAFFRRPQQPARSAGAALRAEADARPRTRHFVLRVDAVLWARARAAAGSQIRGGGGAGRGGAGDAGAGRIHGSPGSRRSSAG